MKRILTLVVALLAVGSVSAQQGVNNFKNRVGVATGSEFSFGPKVGLNFSNVHNVDADTKTSFHIGGFAEMKFNDMFAFYGELLYSRMGFRYSGYADDAKYKVRVNYLTLPVLAKVYLWRGLAVEAGPQVDILLNGKSVVKSGGTTEKTDLDNLNAIGLTIAIGASYDVCSHIFVGARYNLGVTNVAKEDFNNQNRGLQLSVGYRF